MRKNLLLSIFCLSAILAFASCSNKDNPNPDEPDKPNIPDNPDKPDNPDEPGTDTFDPFDEDVVLNGLSIETTGENVIYFGEQFSIDNYTVNLVLSKPNPQDPENDFFMNIKLDNVSFDDSKVNYAKEGEYTVKITGRYLRFVAEEEITVTVKADRYEYLGVEHLYAIKCDEIKTVAIGSDASKILPGEMKAVYTNNEYDSGELVLTETNLRGGSYTLEGLDEIDTSKAGSHVVYVTYSKDYEHEGKTVTITCKTFFIVVVE